MKYVTPCRRSLFFIVFEKITLLTVIDFKIINSKTQSSGKIQYRKGSGGNLTPDGISRDTS